MGKVRFFNWWHNWESTHNTYGHLLTSSNGLRLGFPLVWWGTGIVYTLSCPNSFHSPSYFSFVIVRFLNQFFCKRNLKNKSFSTVKCAATQIWGRMKTLKVSRGRGRSKRYCLMRQKIWNRKSQSIWWSYTLYNLCYYYLGDNGATFTTTTTTMKGNSLPTITPQQTTEKPIRRTFSAVFRKRVLLFFRPWKWSRRKTDSKRTKSCSHPPGGPTRSVSGMLIMD